MIYYVFRRRPRTYKELEFDGVQFPAIYANTPYAHSLAEMWMQVFDIMEGEDA